MKIQNHAPRNINFYFYENSELILKILRLLFVKTKIIIG